jgi:hypothetical protein
MSSRRLAEIQARRERLLALSARQREEIGRALHAWSLPTVMMQQGVAGWNYLKAHPELLAIAVGAIVAFRQRRTVKWVSVAFAAWEIYQRFKDHLPRR